MATAVAMPAIDFEDFAARINKASDKFRVTGVHVTNSFGTQNPHTAFLHMHIARKHEAGPPYRFVGAAWFLANTPEEFAKQLDKAIPLEWIV